MSDKEEYLDQLLHGVQEGNDKKVVPSETSHLDILEKKKIEQLNQLKEAGQPLSESNQEAEPMDDFSGQNNAEEAEIEDFDDLNDLGDLGELGDLGDLSDLSDMDDVDDLDDLSDMDDADDLDDLEDEVALEFQKEFEKEVDVMQLDLSDDDRDFLKPIDEVLVGTTFKENKFEEDDDLGDIESELNEADQHNAISIEPNYGGSSIKSVPLEDADDLGNVEKVLQASTKTDNIKSKDAQSEIEDNNLATSSESGFFDLEARAEASEIQEEYLATSSEKIDRVPRSIDSEDDLLSMLSDMGDEEGEIADIAAMLKAHDNNEDIEVDTMGFESIDQPEHSSALENENKLLEKVTVKKKKFLKQFFAKLFGEVETTESNNNEPVSGEVEELETLTDLTEEEQKIMMNLQEGQISESLDEAPTDNTQNDKAKKKEEKKLLQEEKKKLAAEKKENMKKLKQERAAQMEAEMSLVAPIPKKPAVLMVVMAISFLVLVIFSSKGLGYRRNLAEATNQFQNNKYVDSYTIIGGTEMKEEDQEFYYKVALLASIQQDEYIYIQTKKLGNQEEELDAIIRGVGKYNAYFDKATSYGVDTEYTAIYKVLEVGLTQDFKMTVEDAIDLYNEPSKTLYSAKIMQVIAGTVNPDVKD